MKKKDKPLKITWEYEEAPDGEDRLREICEYLLEPAMTVTSVNCNGTVCTVNTSAGAYISGDYTQITSCSPSNINGTVVGPISGGTGQGYFSFASSYSGSPTGCTVQRWSKIQLEWFRVKLSPGAN